MAFEMDRASSERWVVISAAIVAGIYAYRRILVGSSSSSSSSSKKGTAKQLAGIGDPVPVGQFAAAWGFVYLVVAIMASANPGLGGSFAILIATGDTLTNAADLFGLVKAQETGALQQSQATAKTGTQILNNARTNKNPTQSGVGNVVGSTAQGIGNVGTKAIP